MTSDLQHCAACEEEYIAGVAACIECGGPLAPGPLERASGRTRGGAPAADESTRLDRLAAELPGLQADHAVRALLLEEIPCRIECQGIQKSYLPGRPPDSPLAMTLPVKIYVAAAQLEPAQEVITSLAEHDDLIGEQWSEIEPDDDADDKHDNDLDDEPAHESLEGGASAPPSQDDIDIVAAEQEPAAESTTFRTIMFIVLAGIVLLFLFGR